MMLERAAKLRRMAAAGGGDNITGLVKNKNLYRGDVPLLPEVSMQVEEAAELREMASSNDNIAGLVKNKEYTHEQ